jgi:hypothetical protein
MLKAITASLLMEQVLAPNFKFKTRLEFDNEPNEPGTIKIRGFKMPSTQRVQQIIESDLNDLKATILQDPQMLRALPGNLEPEVINKVLIPKIIQIKYPELSSTEIEEVRQYVVADSVVKNGEIKTEGDKRFITMAGKFINIDELNLDLIDRINPFQKAFEILSKSVTVKVLRLIQETIDATRIEITEEEALILAPKLKQFMTQMGRLPDINSNDLREKRLAEFILFMKNIQRERSQQNG